MSEPSDNAPLTSSAIPEAVVDARRRVSLVWLVPLVALLVAAWLGYRAYTERGPLVSISFETAEGLEAGKTRVRFKDVDIGLVEAIELTPDLVGVRVRARLSRQVAGFVTANTRFWVVRPRLTRGQVSGLETLVGGTYIAADLVADDGAGQAPVRSFTGLEEPPVVAGTAAGSGFVLLADTLGSLVQGSPVLYHGIEVGRVVNYALRDDGRVEVRIFVDAPHDRRVGAGTRFWNASGLALSVGAGGFNLNTDSLASVLLGGVAFGHPDGQSVGEPVPAGHPFTLYADRDTAFKPPLGGRETWQLAFHGSVRGLAVGAPVELRGIRIGEVTGIRLVLDGADATADTQVGVAVDPTLLGIALDGDAAHRALWDGLVGRGLRAQLKIGNLLSGALYVDLDFYPDDPPREIAWDADPPRLPTVRTAFEEMSVLLGRLSRLPLEQIGADLSASLAALRDTLNGTNRLLQRVDRETASELNQTLAQTRETLQAVERVLAPNSPISAEVQRVLQELGLAARSLRIMSDYLERHPEALLRGKDGEAR